MKSKRLSLKWEVETFKDAGLKIVGPDDFLRKSCQVFQREMTSSPQLIPYCLDFSSQESIYCLGLDPKYAQQAVFHYEYLREHVKKIVTIPWERDQRSVQCLKNNPVFLLSPGRCGSTLLNKMMEKINVWGISEPDFLTQAILECARMRRSNFDTSSILDQINKLTHDLLSPYQAVNNYPIIITMRSQANVYPECLYSDIETKPKYIFLIRQFIPWAISMARTFGHTPDAIYGSYNTALKFYKYLKKNTDCLLLRYEDLNENNQIPLEKLSIFLNVNVRDDFKFNYGLNSQDGSFVKTMRDHGVIEPNVLKGIEAIWEKIGTSVLNDFPEFSYAH